MKNLALRVLATTAIACLLGGAVTTLNTWDQETLAMPSALGLVSLVVGVVVLCYCGIRAKGRSIEEAYRLGYDIGFERGYRQANESLAVIEPASEAPWFERGWWARTDG